MYCFKEAIFGVDRKKISCLFPAFSFLGVPAPGIIKVDLNLWFQEKKKRIFSLEL